MRKTRAEEEEQEYYQKKENEDGGEQRRHGSGIVHSASLSSESGDPELRLSVISWQTSKLALI